MESNITDILFEKYGIHARLKGKAECPFCHKLTFSITRDNTMGKCFHPACGKKLFAGEIGSHPSRNHATEQPHQSCTLQEYADTKKLSIEFLQSIKMSESTRRGAISIQIPYFDEKGEEVTMRYRRSMKKVDGIDCRFAWKTKSKPLPYGLWKIHEARTSGYIVIVEGESDCHTLWYQGFPAIGIPGANTWKETWADYLEGIQTIYIVKEPDSGGEAVITWISKSKIKDRVKVLSLEPFKDPSELYLSDTEGFKQKWQEALQNARLFSEVKENNDQSIKEDAWEKCQSIASDPKILNRFIQDIKQKGLVGEEQNAKIIFLALNSRLLNRPVSLSIKGPSSCGKSFTVEQVLNYFPESTYYRLTAMSDRDNVPIFV